MYLTTSSFLNLFSASYSKAFIHTLTPMMFSRDSSRSSVRRVHCIVKLSPKGDFFLKRLKVPLSRPMNISFTSCMFMTAFMWACSLLSARHLMYFRSPVTKTCLR